MLTPPGTVWSAVFHFKEVTVQQDKSMALMECTHLTTSWNIPTHSSPPSKLALARTQCRPLKRMETRRRGVVKIHAPGFNKSLSQVNRLVHEIPRGNTTRGRENANVACAGSRVSDSSSKHTSAANNDWY